MPVLYANRASSTLAAGITNSATSLSVAAGHGARFPAVTAPDYFYATLEDSSGNVEIVKVTARSTDTFTVVRGQDDTSGFAFSAGATVELRVVKAMLDDFKADTRSGYLPLTGGTLSGSLTATQLSIAADTNNRWVSGSLYLRGSSPTLFFRDADGNSAMVHVNSNTFYVLAGGADSESWAQINGRWPLEINLTNNDAAFGGNITLAGHQVLHAGTAVTVAQGGTGSTSLAANNVLLGNGTGALQAVAPGSSGNVLTSNGTTWTSAAPAAGGGSSADIQQFSTVGSSTWTKPSGAKMVHVVIFGGGGGGGSGRRRGTTTPLAAGGGGGGAGGRTEIWLPASSLGSTLTVTVGAGGSGAPGVTTNDTNGSAGGSGGTSSFGSFRARFGAGGSGATTSGTTSGGAPGSQIPAVTYTSTSVLGTAGTGGSNSIGDGGRGGLSPGSGGGGAGHTAGSTANYQGGMGGRGGDAILASSYLGSLGGGGLAGAVNSNGGSGGNATIPYIGGDGGGGGGSGSPVGNGGNGGFPGGGGGGGAASTAVTSGAGGNGADGFVIVTTYF